MLAATSPHSFSGSEQSSVVVDQSWASATPIRTAPPLWVRQKSATGPETTPTRSDTVVASAEVPAGATIAMLTESVTPAAAGAVVGAGAGVPAAAAGASTA